MTRRDHLARIGPADRRSKKRKSLAARRAGITRVLFPKLDEKDLVDILEEAKQKIKFIPVQNVDEVLTNAREPVSTP